MVNKKAAQLNFGVISDRNSGSVIRSFNLSLLNLLIRQFQSCSLLLKQRLNSLLVRYPLDKQSSWSKTLLSEKPVFWTLTLMSSTMASDVITLLNSILSKVLDFPSD